MSPGVSAGDITRPGSVPTHPLANSSMPVFDAVPNMLLAGAPNKSGPGMQKNTHRNLPSPVNVHRLEKLFEGYDPSRAHFVIQGLSDGFVIPSTTDWPPVHSNNHGSAFQQYAQMDEDIRT